MSTPTTERNDRFRIKPLWVLGVFGLGFAIHLLLPQVGQLHQTLKTLRGAHVGWLTFVFLATVATYVFAGVALKGASSTHLPLGRTIAVQVAASFMNRLAPGSLGGIGLNARYLEKEGVSRGATTAVIGTNAAAGLVLHVILLVIAIVFSGQHGLAGHARLPNNWPWLVAGLLFFVLIGLCFFPAIRRRLAKPMGDAGRELWSTVRSPGRAFLLLGGCLGVTLAFIAALAGSLAAYGSHTPIEHVALTYLIASAVASAAPTPGGLGAMEAALVATFTALGVESAPAIAGVLTFRLATFWLPIIPGYLAFRSLRKRSLL